MGSKIGTIGDSVLNLPETGVKRFASTFVPETFDVQIDVTRFHLAADVIDVILFGV